VGKTDGVKKRILRSDNRIMTSRPSTAAPILAVLAIGLSLAWLPLAVLSEEPPTKALPKDVEQILAWLPMDTESLYVARSFDLNEPQPGLFGRKVVKVVDLKAPFFSVSAGYLRVFSDRLKSPMPQAKVKLAMTGGRNAETVSVFASVRKEGCSVVVLEKPLGDDAQQWKDALRAKSKSTRTIVDQEVFVFPEFEEMDRPRELKEWQGTYVVLLEPDTILCATSDRYLKDLLQRQKSPGKGRSLPANLPEWKLIDTSSPAWMLWRPAADKEAGIHGGGWMWRADVAEFIYVPDGEIATLEKAWHNRWDDDESVFPRPKRGESLTQRRSGALVVRVPTKDVSWQRAFPLWTLILGAFETEQLDLTSISSP
jgi:hypothetical protein